MQKIYRVFVALFLILGLSAIPSAGQFIPNAPFKPQYTPAPDFTLKDLKGKTFRMSAQRGKPVLIFFGTTWCPGCREEIPKYKKVYETYAPKGLEVVYINIMEPARKVARFAEDGSVAALYNAVGVPMMILVDKDGYVIKVGFSSTQMPLDKVTPVQ